MPWITGFDPQISETGGLKCISHIEAEILLDVGLRTFEERCNRNGKTLKNRRRGILIHHHQCTTWAQQPERFRQHGMNGVLRQFMTNELKTDQIG